MEVLGYLGFVFGIAAIGIANKNKNEVEELKEQVKENAQSIEQLNQALNSLKS